mgnify:CR=1 FL=1
MSVRELKDHVSEYLRRAAAGEEVVVTSHGRPVARLCALATSAETEEEALARLRAQPWVRPARSKGGLRLARPGLGLEPGEKTLAERVSEDRG